MSEFTQSPNDAPIKVPAEDRFGMDPFAQALAASIRKIKAPEGTVIALNGPWGSGKSSAVNLILHHLKDAIAAGEIAVVNFACWWFRGEEALALAFFRELYAGLCRGTAFSASSRIFDLNGEARMARTKQSSPIIPPA